MRREFVANVSHELKTPLHLLLMYSENLKNNIENIDKVIIAIRLSKKQRG